MSDIFSDEIWDHVKDLNHFFINVPDIQSSIPGIDGLDYDLNVSDIGTQFVSKEVTDGVDTINAAFGLFFKAWDGFDQEKTNHTCAELFDNFLVDLNVLGRILFERFFQGEQIDEGTYIFLDVKIGLDRLETIHECLFMWSLKVKFSLSFKVLVELFPTYFLSKVFSLFLYLVHSLRPIVVISYEIKWALVFIMVLVAHLMISLMERMTINERFACLGQLY